MEKYQGLFDELTRGLVRILGEKIDRIVLFGSFARGTQTEESDIDIATFVEPFTEEMHDQMTDLIVDLQLEYDVVLSVVLIDVQNYLGWQNVLPFYRNVKEEGITLWKAA
ncbi:MAG: nucleotidyltransferase domain-containing protein [Lachnospiraceae bacterium]|nr:nucleotidyltransferase domain-containing protein [Lachnospiraceae bacterium]